MGNVWWVSPGELFTFTSLYKEEVKKNKEDGPYLSRILEQKFNNLLNMDPGMYREHQRGREDGNEKQGGNKCELGDVSHVTSEYHRTESEMMVEVCLDFEVQQVAVDLVVNIGVVLLLAQVQPWDVHSGINDRSAAVQVFVQVGEHLSQLLHVLLVGLQQHGLEVHWQSVSQN